jgi:hypothetical protein
MTTGGIISLRDDGELSCYCAEFPVRINLREGDAKVVCTAIFTGIFFAILEVPGGRF